MTHIIRIVCTLPVFLLLMATANAQHHQGGYAGLQRREIKALSSDAVNVLRLAAPAVAGG